MSLDQRLSQAARHLADGVVAPEIDLGTVRERVRAGRRRTAALAAAAAVLVVVAVGAALGNGRPSSAPEPILPVPTPTPTPTELRPGWSPNALTAEEIVTAAGAKAMTLGVAAGDPGTRLAIWKDPAGYVGAVVTTDGYRTAKYVSVPGVDGGFRILSPTDDLFLVTNPGTQNWLVGTDGNVRQVILKHGEVLPTDDRLWFQCNDEGWRDSWCALDPEAATAYIWPDAWDGSAVPPQRGGEPWGANPEPRAVGNTGVLEAWWGVGSKRHVRSLASARYGDYVLGCPSGLMALWSKGSDPTVDIHTSLDGGVTWQVASFHAPSADQWWKLRCAPDGSFLAVDSERGTVVWRAEAGAAAFAKVFSAPGTADSIGIADLWVYGDRAYASGDGVLAVSDDGKAWTKVRTWR